MSKALLGRKIGMTRMYNEEGNNIPVTVIAVGPCFVSQIKTEATDGYNAVQLGFEAVKGRDSTFPMIAHDAKAGLDPMDHHREVRVDSDEVGSYELGQELNVTIFDEIKFVDVIGDGKGKGFAGPMKRWGFKGQQATHGVERKHRSPGSIGGRASNLGTGKPKKGIRMGGRMGGKRITVRSLGVVACDAEKGLILVKGSVPGANKGLVIVREATRLWKSKASK